MKKRIIRICAAILLFALPFCLIASIGFKAAGVYENSYSAALCDKYETLKNCTDKKVILVGGSSLPFGIRSDILEEYLNGRVVINMGVYAAFGTASQLEIALKYAHDGDIIIFAPEISAQTYSMYFGADTMWQAAVSTPEMIKCLSKTEQSAMNKTFFPFMIKTIPLMSQGEAADSVYNRSNFNAYGDMSLRRACNIMANGYDETQLIYLDGIIDDDFIEFVNESNSKAVNKGAFLYFTFSPSNLSAVEFDEDESDEFVNMLNEKLDCDVFGTPWDFSYNSKYFYDTNYHLNDAGAVLHTVNYLKAMKAIIGEKEIDVEIPEPGNEDEDEIRLDDTNSVMFEYEEYGGTIYIKGVKDEYKSFESLSLPVSTGGKRVIGLSRGCFAGCTSLKSLTIPNGYAIFDSGVFEGCENLERIDLQIKDPGRATVPSTGLFDGASDKLKVYIPKESYPSYAANYSWRRYASFFVISEE